MLILDGYKWRRIRQTSHTEGILSHLLGTSRIGGDHSDGGILSDLRRTCNVLARSYWLESAIGHRGLYLIERHTWHGDTDRVVVACIEHIHQVGRDSGTGVDHSVLLREVSPDDVAVTIDGLQIPGKGEITRGITDTLINIIAKRHFLVADVDIRHLGSIDGSHDDVGRELVTTDDGLRVGDDEGLEGVYTDILHVDILHQRMEHFSLGIAHIALQLRQQGDSGSCRHRLKHIFLPVLTHSNGIGRYFCREV